MLKLKCARPFRLAIKQDFEVQVLQFFSFVLICFVIDLVIYSHISHVITLNFNEKSGLPIS